MDGSFYGNIGRCLFFEDHIENALNCYKKSFKLLYKTDNTHTILNKGYACRWIAEALIKIKDFENAHCFYKRSSDIWKIVSPHRSKEMEKEANTIVKKNELPSKLLDMNEWEVEKHCTTWLME